MSTPSTQQPRFLIVGAGVYGASTALTLARIGYKHITVLDRSADGFAAPDAASHDVNKIIRADYGGEQSGQNYRSLAKESISHWRTDPVISKFYHEVGLVLHSGHRNAQIRPDAKAYVAQGVENAATSLPGERELPRPGSELPRLAWSFASDEEAKNAFPPNLRGEIGEGLKGFGSVQTGYVNPRGGWAEANNAVRAYLAEAKRLGVKTVPNSIVTELLYHEDQQQGGGKGKAVRGVKTASGEVHEADHVVIAAGAWSRLLLQKLLPASSPVNQLPPASPSAQCVVTLQLDEADRAALKNAPVVLNFDTGLYVFEPNADGILKLAIHSAAGYRNPAPRLDLETAYPTFEAGEEANVVTPSSIYKDSADTFIPNDKVSSMLEELYTLYPRLRTVPRDRIRTRVCWYSDSADENWIISPIEGIENLVVAGGDSGHAYKFLPTLGRLVAARLGVPEVQELTQHQKRVFSFDHHRELAEKLRRGEKVESAGSGRAPGVAPSAAPGGGGNKAGIVKVDLEGANPRARL